MSELPQIPENAQKILRIFDHFDAKPGDVLRVDNFIAVGERQRWQMADLQQGLEFLIQNGRIGKKDDGFTLKKRHRANARTATAA